MDGKQNGFTLIEILVVVTIIGVLAGLVVVLIPKGQFEAQKTECMSNVRQIVGLLEVGEKYPNYAGPGMLLYLVKKGDINRDQDKLGLLFCPGDVNGWDLSGGVEAYKDLDLTKRGEYDALTSYAARDMKNKQCVVRKGDSSTQVLVADETEEYHQKKGLVVGINGGAAKWRDKVDFYGIDIETPLTIGEGSDQDELRCLVKD